MAASSTSAPSSSSAAGTGDDSMFKTMFNKLEPRRKLLTVASCNMVEHLEEIIQEKLINLDAPLQEQNGDRALHISCKKGHQACVRRLLDAGADADIGNDFGFTPMAMALRHNQVECVKLLLLSGSPLSDPAIVWLSQKSDSVYTWTGYKTDLINLLLIATPDFSTLGPDINQAMYNKFLKDEEKGEVVKFYLLTGNRLTEVQQAEINQYSNKEVKAWLKNFQGPKSLQHCCRLAVRKSLSPNTFSASKRLEIPQRLQGFLVFSEMTC